MSSFRASIVVLTQEGIGYLRETIPALQRISLRYGYELIVVDNGSTDGSVDFLSQYPGVLILENGKNLGFGAGKNIGVAAASGDHILLLDNDILIHDEEIIEKLIVTLPKDAGFVQVPLLDKNQMMTKYYGIYFGSYGAISHHSPIDLQNILAAPSEMVEIGAGTGACLFFKKDTWNVIGGFDESQLFNLDDIDIGPRAWILGYKNYLYTKAFFTHLGVNKTVRAEVYAMRFRMHFSGHLRAILKNYQCKTLIRMVPAFIAYSFAKAIKFSIVKSSPSVFVAYILSVSDFVRRFPSTLRERRMIQAKRLRSDKELFALLLPRY